MLQYTPDEYRRDAEFFSALNLPLCGEPAPFAVPMLECPGCRHNAVAALRERAPAAGCRHVGSRCDPGDSSGKSEREARYSRCSRCAGTKEAAEKTETANPILAAKPTMLQLAEAKDFARGRHFGTAVTHRAG